MWLLVREYIPGLKNHAAIIEEKNVFDGCDKLAMALGLSFISSPAQQRASGFDPVAQVGAQLRQLIRSQHIDAIFGGALSVCVAQALSADVEAFGHETANLFDYLPEFVDGFLGFGLLARLALNEQSAVVFDSNGVDFVAGFGLVLADTEAHGVLTRGEQAREFEEHVFLGPATGEEAGAVCVKEFDVVVAGGPPHQTFICRQFEHFGGCTARRVVKLLLQAAVAGQVRFVSQRAEKFPQVVGLLTHVARNG